MRVAVFMQLASAWSREAVLRLSEQGHQVHVIDFAPTNGGVDPSHAHGVERVRRACAAVHLIRSRTRTFWRYLLDAPQLRHAYVRSRADALLTLWGGGWATMSYLSGVRPYAVFVGGGDILRVSGVNRSISRHALKAASIVFANGRYFAERARAFAPRAKVVPLCYGVDLRRFCPLPRAHDSVTVVCTRQFSAGGVHNNEYLLEGLALLPREVPDFQVVFASSGPAIGAAQALADRLLSPDRRRTVRFLGGVTDDGMVQQLQAADIYVSLSRYDGTSISLLEALACGLFPILSDIPQNREWVQPHLGNGILVPLDQPLVLANVLQRAIADHETRRRAVEMNRQLAVEHADGARNMASLARQLQDVIQGGGRSDDTR